MDFTRVKINTTVPLTHVDVVREALGKAGAGQIGEYSFCSFLLKVRADLCRVTQLILILVKQISWK
jgi:hypothetical protein